jgi:AraC-like DNA-binding protein
MIYIRHIPSSPLNRYINNVYYVDGLMPYPRAKVLPFPALDLTFNLGSALRVCEGDHPERVVSFGESWCVGLWNVCHIIDWPPDMRFFGVTFKPGGASAFLTLPLFELHNQVVSTDAIWRCFTAEIRERLYAAPTIQAGFALLEKWLLARLREAPYGLSIVQYAAAQIARQHGALSIRALSDDIGISQTHLVTLFKRMVGTLPKELARVHRLERILLSIDPAQPVDWTQIAHYSGYYDQAHFNKDFGAFTGYSPTDYLRVRRQLCAKNPEQKRLRRLLPIV